MECFRCISICPSSSLEIDTKVSCQRLEEKFALNKDKEKCNECDICNEVCPMGDIASSSMDCSFCIVCRSRPGCISSSADRAHIHNSINSFFHLMMSKIRFSTSDPLQP